MLQTSYDIFLFDLDGTLTDPGIGITNSVAYALEKFGIEVPERSQLYKFIGPPLITSFKEYYGFTEEQARQGVVYYREYFREKGIFENVVYDGTLVMLKELKAAGKKVLMATSKPEEFAKRILDYFDMDEYFDVAAGASMDETRCEKADVIRYALEQIDIPDISKVVMIGDRKHDVLGAKENGLASIGVLYGYGSKEELSAAGADILVGSPKEILKFI